MQYSTIPYPLSPTRIQLLYTSKTHSKSVDFPKINAFTYTIKKTVSSLWMAGVTVSCRCLSSALFHFCACLYSATRVCVLWRQIGNHVWMATKRCKLMGLKFAITAHEHRGIVSVWVVLWLFMWHVVCLFVCDSRLYRCSGFPSRGTTVNELLVCCSIRIFSKTGNK